MDVQAILILPRAHMSEGIFFHVVAHMMCNQGKSPYEPVQTNQGLLCLSIYSAVSIAFHSSRESIFFNQTYWAHRVLGDAESCVPGRINHGPDS